jgi:hypothetical protein
MHVAALELSDPAYDSTSRSITYTARMLTLGDGALTADDLSLAVDALPTQFGDATLFIDDYDIYITGFVPGKRLHQSVEVGRTTP